MRPMPGPHHAPPREPEIELLGRIARRGLWVLRRVLWIAGAVGVVYGVSMMIAVDAVPDPDPAPLPKGPALGFVWICAGWPPIARVGWLFGRGRWLALGFAALLWAGPSLLASDPEYGFILRFFATLIACVTLLVWRTLWRLTAIGSRSV